MTVGCLATRPRPTRTTALPIPERAPPCRARGLHAKFFIASFGSFCVFGPPLPIEGKSWTRSPSLDTPSHPAGRGKGTKRAVLLASTEERIEGYAIAAYKGILQGQTWNELLRQAEALGANAILNTCFDDALDVDTLFHSRGVVVRRERSPDSLFRSPVRR
jgi:hypothetical protein